MRSEVRPGRREAADDRGARSVRGRALDCRLGAGHGEERTTNIWYMVVTLDVSKLSGWLKADAPCRVEKRAYDAGRGAERRRRAWGGGGASGAHGNGPT